MSYQGHKNWSHWNVALWLGNDEPLYRLAQDTLINAKLDKWKRHVRTRDSALQIAARRLQASLPARTPDGARYSLVALKSALEGFCE